MPDKPIATYSHRAKPYSQEAEFRLMPAHLRIEQGRRSGDFPYRDIVMLRLTYRPRNTTNEGYMAKLYRRDRRTASLTNLSWKGLVEMERRDADYRRFVELMIAQIHKANPGVILQAGMPGWQHKTTAFAGLAAFVTLIIVASQAVLHNSLPMAALTAALALYFGWWTIRYLGRNRPRAFTVDALPGDVLPKADAVRPPP